MSLWVDDRGILRFSAGNRTWTLSSATIALSSTGEHCVFSISGDAGDQVVKYRSPASSVLNRFDPAYDALDEELDDLLRFVMRLSADPTWQVRYAAGLSQRLQEAGRPWFLDRVR